jgi:hypothetical protein
VLRSALLLGLAACSHAPPPAVIERPPAAIAAGEQVIEIALAGDVIPHARVLENRPAEILADMPAGWARADARLFNLEAPVGDRRALAPDLKTLAYAAPVSWFHDLVDASRATAVVGANNHACDLGAPGVEGTLAAARGKTPLVGVGEGAWRAVPVAEKGGHRVCVVAWTMVLNERKKKTRDTCRTGVARATSAEQLEKRLSSPGLWDGCDARVAFIHGGNQYYPQGAAVLDHATVAASYVDAIIFSHPHVPDVVEPVAAPRAIGGRAAGRGVPVFRSLGNFVSNQGVGWSMKRSVEIVGKHNVPDALQTVWTRVAMIAHLRFAWDGPAGPPARVAYGFELAFLEREPRMRLRPLPDSPSDPVAARLRTAPAPFGGLLDHPCRGARCDGMAVPAKPTPPAIEWSKRRKSDHG